MTQRTRSAPAGPAALAAALDVAQELDATIAAVTAAAIAASASRRAPTARHVLDTCDGLVAFLEAAEASGLIRTPREWAQAIRKLRHILGPGPVPEGPHA